MRILEFNVDKQRLSKRPGCDFSGLVAGSVGYLQAKFYFQDDWNRCSTKIGRFWLGDEEYAKKLDDNNSCEIPPEVLTSKKFEVSALGAAPDYRIETNKISVRQVVS